MSRGGSHGGRLLCAAAARQAVELGKAVEGPGLGQLFGEVVLEHEGLDGQRGWPLLLAVAEDWSALSTTPCGNMDGKAIRWTDTGTTCEEAQEQTGDAAPWGRGKKWARPGLYEWSGVGVIRDCGLWHAPPFFCKAFPIGYEMELSCIFVCSLTLHFLDFKGGYM